MDDSADDGVEPTIIVYWRPGCPFCSRLRRGLARAGVTTMEVNIWEDSSGAALVRSVANGNETVPTVTVGAKSMVNPSVQSVLDAVHVHDVPESIARVGRWRRRRNGR